MSSTIEYEIYSSIGRITMFPKVTRRLIEVDRNLKMQSEDISSINEKIFLMTTGQIKQAKFKEKLRQAAKRITQRGVKMTVHKFVPTCAASRKKTSLKNKLSPNDLRISLQTNNGFHVLGINTDETPSAKNNTMGGLKMKSFDFNLDKFKGKELITPYKKLLERLKTEQQKELDYEVDRLDRELEEIGNSAPITLSVERSNKVDRAIGKLKANFEKRLKRLKVKKVPKISSIGNLYDKYFDVNCKRKQEKQMKFASKFRIIN